MSRNLSQVADGAGRVADALNLDGVGALAEAAKIHLEERSNALPQRIAADNCEHKEVRRERDHIVERAERLAVEREYRAQQRNERGHEPPSR